MTRKLVLDPNAAREIYSAGKIPKTKSVQTVSRINDSGGEPAQEITPVYETVLSDITPSAGSALTSITPSTSTFVTSVAKTQTTISYVESLTSSTKSVCTDVSVSNGALVFTFENITQLTPTTNSATFDAVGLVGTSSAVTSISTNSIQPIVSITKQTKTVVGDIETDS